MSPAPHSEATVERSALTSDPGERFEQDGSRLTHTLNVGALNVRSYIELPGQGLSRCERRQDPKSEWWSTYLRGARPVPVSNADSGRRLRAVDLFSGVGGLALGVRQLAAELGARVVTELVADSDIGAVAVYVANHETRLRCTKSVTSLIDYRVRGRAADACFVYPPEFVDPHLAEAVTGIDIVMAGPPCQGHSNLNNRTRRSDKRNLYYLTVPAFAVAAGARIAIIENVPDVEHDDMQVVDTAQQLFEAAGYAVERGTLRADAMGWPQTRRRSFLVARQDATPVPLDAIADTLADPEPRTLEWAIGDLLDRQSDGVMDAASELSSENRDRVDWLFDNHQYDLPNSERPECHRGGTTYGAVYGRMRMDGPAPTITTGFMTPGRGRYIHPTRRRTLTPQEAARIQGFPDSYRFVTDSQGPPPRTKLAKWIGDAVPMPLGYGAALSALGPGLGTVGLPELPGSQSSLV